MAKIMVVDDAFLDIVMKDNGLEILPQIFSKNPHAKVIICSSVAGMRFVVEEAIQKGAVACVRKPFNIEEIKKAISMCLY